MPSPFSQAKTDLKDMLKDQAALRKIVNAPILLPAEFQRAYAKLEKVNAAIVKQGRLVKATAWDQVGVSMGNIATAGRRIAVSTLAAGVAIGTVLTQTAGHYSPGSVIRYERAVGSLAATVGQVLSPSMELLIQKVQGVAKWVANLSPSTKEWINAMVQLAVPIAAVAIAFGGMAVVVAPILSIFTSIAGVLAAMAPLISGIALALNPVAAIALIIAAALGVSATLIAGKLAVAKITKALTPTGNADAIQSAKFPVRELSDVREAGRITRLNAAQLSPNASETQLKKMSQENHGDPQLEEEARIQAIWGQRVDAVVQTLEDLARGLALQQGVNATQ